MIHGIAYRQHVFLNLCQVGCGDIEGVEVVIVQEGAQVGLGLLLHQSGRHTVGIGHNLAAAKGGLAGTAVFVDDARLLQ